MNTKKNQPLYKEAKKQAMHDCYEYYKEHLKKEVVVERFIEYANIEQTRTIQDEFYSFSNFDPRETRIINELISRYEIERERKFN